MTTMELRGNFVSLLAAVEDPDLLQKMLEKCIEMLSREDRLDDLDPLTIAALEKAIAESYDESDVIENSQVHQMAFQWLKQ